MMHFSLNKRTMEKGVQSKRQKQADYSQIDIRSDRTCRPIDNTKFGHSLGAYSYSESGLQLGSDKPKL
jgi:hypothetical protein